MIAVRAQKVLLEDLKVLAEPAAACVLAAAERLRPRFAPDATVALVLCGGNTTLQDVVRWQAQFGIA